MHKKDFANAVTCLRAGTVVVMPTDTIYGIVGSALLPKAVRRIYRLRKRNLKKPLIILIGDISQLAAFGATVTAGMRRPLKSFWPGKISIIFSLKKSKKFAYLHRGTHTLAFRLPKPSWLRKLLLETGPLVAPSANHEGKLPARTIREAKKYFGTAVKLYIDAGKFKAKPSTLITFQHGRVKILRQGAVRVAAARAAATRIT